MTPHTFLAGIIYPVLGRYEQAVEQAGKAIELDPEFTISYFILAWRNQGLGRFGEAERALQLGAERKLNPYCCWVVMISLSSKVTKRPWRK